MTEAPNTPQAPEALVFEEAEQLSPQELEAAIQELVDLVLEETETPVDRWAVAATLESRGLRDLDAAVKFGKWDIFDLAEEVYYRCRAQMALHPPPPRPRPRTPRLKRAGRAVGWYLRGTFFVVPLAMQLGALLVLGYNMWASLEFTNLQATIVAMALIGSFVATAGFSQAIGRLGPSFTDHDSYRLARRITYRIVLIGLATALAIAAAWWAFNLVEGSFPTKTLLTSLVYFVALAALTLWQAILYMLHRWIALVVTTAGGIAIVGLAQEQTSLSLGIHEVHWIALGATALASFGWATLTLERKARRAGDSARPALPPRGLLLTWLTLPYVAYGIAYSLLLFLDRVIAWTAADRPQPLVIWFQAPYEIGLDWAVLAVVPVMALLEYSVHQFASIVVPAQEGFCGTRIREHNRHLRRFYLRQLGLLAALAVAAGVATYQAVLWARGLDGIREVSSFFSDPVTLDVFVAGVVGYSLLAWGLMSGIFLFSLARPAMVAGAMAAAVVVCLTVGIALSRGGEYWQAVYGMAAGSLVFALIATVCTLRVMGRIDYYYYSAY